MCLGCGNYAHTQMYCTTPLLVASGCTGESYVYKLHVQMDFHVGLWGTG